MSNKYGLILKGKKNDFKPPTADFRRPSVFGSESDSDNDNEPKMKMKSLGPGVSERRIARKIQEKALAEDPTVFQYDELYDEIETKRQEEKQSTNSVKQSKYINRLLESAKRRTIDNERRVERMIQKEREKEGEEFKDKEAFVTTSYRKKLEELKQAEEREKREDYLEAIGDVRKQRDLGGFYRHLYEQKMGKDDAEQQPELKDENVSEKTHISENVTQTSEVPARAKLNKPRIYRKRHSSDEEPDGATESIGVAAKKSHIQSNLDADSDFSIDSSSDSESDNDSKQKKELPTTEENTVKTIEQKSKSCATANDLIQTPALLPNPLEIKEETIAEQAVEEIPELPKIDIWKKRTVGVVFDEALKRYYERKAARNG